MHGSRTTAHTDLEREVSNLLSRWDGDVVGQIDAVLADCAAEVLRLRVAELRAHRELDATLANEADLGSWSGPRRALFLERKRLAGERTRIQSLMGSLRMHRDRLGPRG
jgi:hypothetical protein